MIRTGILTIALASFGFAQIRVPVAGYVVDSASTQLRPIIGAPGASLIGESVALPDRVLSVAISPDQQFAILSGDQLTVTAMTPDGLGSSITVDGAISSPDRIEFSAGSSAAALYSAKLNRVQIVTGFPATPQILHEFTLGNDLLALAVSDDAGMLLTANSNGNVSLFLSDGTARLVASGDSIVALQFLPDLSRAIAIDRTRNQVLLLSGLPDKPTVQAFQDEQAGLNSPEDVRITADGRQVLIANSGGNNILRVDVATREVTSIACAFRPAFLQPLLQGAFLITDDDHKLFWMLDPGVSRVSFIPGLIQ